MSIEIMVFGVIISIIIPDQILLVFLVKKRSVNLGNFRIQKMISVQDRGGGEI
jgi:hypothetical protein